MLPVLIPLLGVVRHNLLRHVDAGGFDKDRAYNDCGAISVSQER